MDTRTGASVSDGAIHFHADGGPFGLCDSRNNSLVYRQPLDANGDVDGQRFLMAGGSAGFSDSTFDAPAGRICQSDVATVFVNNRLYINDGGNSAIRYVSYNE